jgi:hypothetical protein
LKCVLSKTWTPAHVIEQRPSERQIQCLRGPTVVVGRVTALCKYRPTQHIHSSSRVTRMTSCSLSQSSRACQVFSYEITLISVRNIFLLSL